MNATIPHSAANRSPKAVASAQTATPVAALMIVLMSRYRRIRKAEFEAADDASRVGVREPADSGTKVRHFQKPENDIEENHEPEREHRVQPSRDPLQHAQQEPGVEVVRPEYGESYSVPRQPLRKASVKQLKLTDIHCQRPPDPAEAQRHDGHEHEKVPNSGNATMANAKTLGRRDCSRL